ncbi:hypothetical protein LEN26_001754 [Aphanomyces euteiches]|nr:hypothetical protein LEN26_001754 [Aphanomyces euteiches]
MSVVDDWDFGADLDFLLPGVTDLEADLASVCDLFPAEPVVDLVEPSKAEPAKWTTQRTGKPKSPCSKKTQTASQRETIQSLQKQVGALEDQLVHVKYAKSTSGKEGKWATLAKRQRHDARKALDEQQELQEAVEFNDSFIGKLVSLLRKRPRLQFDNLVKDWHIYKLPAEQSQRHRAIHGIADRQRARKSTEYINADLVTQSENIVRVRPVVHAKAQAVKYEVVSYIRLPAPCAAVSRALWQVYAAGDKTPPSSSSAQVIREQVDEHTIYERFTDTRDGVTSYACTVRKYFADDHEHLIVLQSVLEDEMHPHMASGAVENESVWVAIEPLDDLSCCVKLLVHLIFDASTYPSGKYDRSIEAITESLGDVKLEEKIPPDGFFVTGILIPQAVDKFPGYASFVSRRIQLKAALRRAVYEKVRDFQQSTKSMVSLDADG